MSLRRTVPLIALLLLGVFGFAPRGTEAQVLDPVRYAIVKSGYILNLARLSQWPESAFENEDSPFVVQVVGADPMAPFLRDLVRAERIGDRPIVVRQLAFPGLLPVASEADAEAWERFAAELRNTHILYVARSELPHVDAMLEAVADGPVLTVSDIDGFATVHGGMVGLSVRGGRVAIDANLMQIEQNEVVVSSRVLQLATIVSE